MKVNVQISSVAALRESLGREGYLLTTENFRMSDGLGKAASTLPVMIDLSDLRDKHLTAVYNTMRKLEEPAARIVKRLINAIEDPSSKSVPNLEDFPRILRAYLDEHKTNLLYSVSSGHKGVAYVVVGVQYHKPDTYRNRDATPFVTVELGYNCYGSYKTRNLHINPSEVNCKIGEILKTYDLVVDDELQADIDKMADKMKKYTNGHGTQVWVRKTGYAQSDRWWWSAEEVDLTLGGRPTRAVIDVETAEAGGNRQKPAIFSPFFTRSVDVPTHPVVNVFSLSYHKNVWVNIGNVREYKYETDIEQRLVLPSAHSRIVGALASNLDALRIENESEDRSRTLRNKAGCSLLVCKGPPGTGKTLTAEVYSEKIGRPLYEVHSGQLGESPAEVDENLTRVLNRAVRLNMVLVINEADIFIKPRGDDMKQNAICATFLKQLEYHKGLVFLTTNREIDDAVESRALAIITYERPEEAERRRLWEMLLAEFNINSLSDKDVSRLVRVMPTMSGRDIQNLILLTNRVCITLETKFSADELIANAVFKSIKVVKEK